MMHRILRASSVLFIQVIIGLGPSWAGGLYVNEFATPSSGVAGAGQEAYAGDASTSFAVHNPAGMTRLRGHHLSLGAGVLVGNTEFETEAGTPFAGGNGGDQAGLAPLLGAHGVYSISNDLKLGMSVFSISGAALDPDDGWSGRYMLQNIEILTLSANPSVAYRINNELSIGGGLIATFGDLNYQLGAPPGGPGQVEADGTDWTFGFNLGLMFEPSPRTRIGVIYVSKQELDFSGDLEVSLGGGAPFSTNSNVKMTFPQFVRVGAYHELNERWALLGSVGWEDWSEFDELVISASAGTMAIPTNWRDTYHFSVGMHYRPTRDWLLQAGITYDTSPVSDGNRTADLPIDRQIRYAIGARHKLRERLWIGGAFEYIDAGDAGIDNPSLLTGKYRDNDLFVFTLNVSYMF
jgi:long-chain fatty acid transport protein